MSQGFFEIRRSLPDLGVGFGLRHEVLEETLEASNQIDWLEITPEGFLGMHGKSLVKLNRAASVYKLISHGVSMSLGSTDELNYQYLKQLKELLDEYQIGWWSDHVSFASSGGAYVNNLLPLPRTAETVKHVAERIKRAQDYLLRPGLVENISFYMPNPPGTEMTEAEFISNILESADCGLLLDVNNVYVNSINQGFDPYQFIDSLPLQRVVQIHVAGHTLHHEGIIDSHAQDVSEPVFDLLSYVLKQVRPKAIMLERDGNFVSFQKLVEELKRIRSIYDEHCPPDSGTLESARKEAKNSGSINVAASSPSKSFSKQKKIVLADMERVFFKAATDRVDRSRILTDAKRGLKSACGFTKHHAAQLDLYGRITDSGAMSTLESMFNATKKLCGENWDWLVYRYCHEYPQPSYTLTDFGKNFPSFLSTKVQLPTKMAIEMAQFEWMRMEVVESEVSWREDLILPEFNSRLNPRLRRPVLNPSLKLHDFSYNVPKVFEFLYRNDVPDCLSQLESGEPVTVAFLRRHRDQEILSFAITPRMQNLIGELMMAKSYAGLFKRLLNADGATQPVAQIVEYMSELNELYRWYILDGDLNVDAETKQSTLGHSSVSSN